MRNDAEVFYEADSYRLKHEQKQNRNVIEFRCNKNL